MLSRPNDRIYLVRKVFNPDLLNIKIRLKCIPYFAVTLDYHRDGGLLNEILNNMRERDGFYISYCELPQKVLFLFSKESREEFINLVVVDL
jgi:hypothetical protein